jgi:hypothetical protein
MPICVRRQFCLQYFSVFNIFEFWSLVTLDAKLPLNFLASWIRSALHSGSHGAECEKAKTPRQLLLTRVIG